MEGNGKTMIGAAGLVGSPSSCFGEAQVVDFARVSRRSRVRYWVRSGLIPSRAKALVWSGVGRA